MDKDFVNSFWLLRMFFKVCKGSWLRTSLFGPLFFSLLPVGCFLAAWHDGTLYLEKVNGGKGLMEHPAFWALFISGPAFVVLLFSICKRMSQVIDLFCPPSPPAKGKPTTKSCHHRVLDLLMCRTPSLKAGFAAMMFFGLLSLLANYQNTRIADRVFGHDVWDSSRHLFGFYAAKVFLAFEWVYLFPLAIYLALAASASILLIVNSLSANRDIKIRPFEPDGCGGYRPLGQAMIVVIYLNVPFALVLAADIHVHRNLYLTIALAVALLVAIVAFEIFAPFLRLHSLLSKGKANRLLELSEIISRQEMALRSAKGPKGIETSTSLSVLAIAEVYRQVKGMHTWPYLPIDRLKWTMPFIPIFLKLMLP